MDASNNRFYQETAKNDRAVLIDYTNHAGVRAVRQIAPLELWFGEVKWHPGEQWLLKAYDQSKDEVRWFAMEQIHRWSSSPISAVDASIAKQLQASMELNARMKNRLKVLASHYQSTASITLAAALEAIVNDRDVPWLPE